MKILSVTAQKPHSTGSGVYLTEVVKGLERLGYEQAVIAGVYEEDLVAFPTEVDFYPVYFHSEKLPFSIVGMSDEMPYDSYVYGQMTEDMVDKFEKAFIEKLDQVMLEFKPDIILCHHLYLLTAIIRNRYPKSTIIGICHGTDIRQVKKIPLKREFILKQIKNLDFIIALQDNQKAEIEKVYGIDQKKMQAVGVGFNNQIFKKMDCGKRIRPIHIIFAGKISEKKGVMSLIRGLDYLTYEKKDVKVSLVGGYGNKNEYDAIVQMAKDCKYQVEFTGKLSQPELAKVLNTSHVFVLPSFYEGLPLVIIEAMACGTKVVCTDLPGIKPWMDEKLRNHGIRFVKPPVMINTDEPVPEYLKIFEMNLAEQIMQSIEDNPVTAVDLEMFSWDGICKKIGKAIEMLL